MLKKKIVDLCTEANILISPETFQFIKSREQPFDFIQKTIAEIAKSDSKPLVLTIDILRKMLEQKSILPASPTIEPDSKGVHIQGLESKLATKINESQIESRLVEENCENCLASQISDEITILKDPTGLMLGEGKIKDISAYFRDKFEKLRILLLKRPDCQGAVTIEQAKGRKSSIENKIKVIGMVLERKEMSGKAKSKLGDISSNSISIELDDIEGAITVIFSGKQEKLIKKATRIMADQVICVEGFITDENVLIATDCFWPDVPFHSKKQHEIPPISVVFLSDIHFGSKYFLDQKFEAFIEWLKGQTGDESQKELSKSVKYIIIAGDLIDGIGVYPTQDKNLAIIDISEQYNLAAKYLKRIPEYIKIIIIPGGPHDAVRKAYPQPSLNKKYAHALYEINNIILLGNPAQLTLHGVNILIFHGDSLDDLIQVIPGLSYQKPAEIMKELVVSRHLTPIYGSSTWIAPEKEDWMVIEDIPEIIHCGHVHVSDFKDYRGVILLNSGTFQDETDYQSSMGIKPTPGRVPLINLYTLKVRFLQF